MLKPCPICHGDGDLAAADEPKPIPCPRCVHSHGAGSRNAEAVRQYLRANLFDGDEGGVVTQPISALLDDLVELFISLP